MFPRGFQMGHFFPAQGLLRQLLSLQPSKRPFPKHHLFRTISKVLLHLQLLHLWVVHQVRGLSKVLKAERGEIIYSTKSFQQLNYSGTQTKISLFCPEDWLTFLDFSCHGITLTRIPCQRAVLPHLEWDGWPLRYNPRATEMLIDQCLQPPGSAPHRELHPLLGHTRAASPAIESQPSPLATDASCALSWGHLLVLPQPASQTILQLWTPRLLPSFSLFLLCGLRGQDPSCCY